MDNTLQKLIVDVCQGFKTQDVEVSQIFDARRFARMAHYAWKQEICFHPDMFKEALQSNVAFSNLSEEDLEDKAHELCNQADFAKMMFHTAFDIEGLTP